LPNLDPLALKENKALKALKENKAPSVLRGFPGSQQITTFLYLIFPIGLLVAATRELKL
jgi:hypothetical protein